MSADPADCAPVTPTRRSGNAIVGVLSDGTPYFAPIGRVVSDGTLVTCHLCGRTFRSVAAHLTSHGWTRMRYREVFGLERGQSLEGDDTRKLRASAFSARLVFEPALRTGSAHGHERARSGQLAIQAAAAARGRPFPEQRRQRSRTAVSVSARAQLARANRERADKHAAAVAADVARRNGYADIGQLVRHMLREGHSLTRISLVCGLDRNWMSRHLPRLDPAVAMAAQAHARPPDARWLPALRAIGFTDVASFLRQRHVVEHATINAIAREVGLSFPTVKSALSRHGLHVEPHAAKRHAARLRSDTVAAELGVNSVIEFIDQGRARGLTWQQLAAESGQPMAWLRRLAAGPKEPRE